jgi:hypothetical protein
MADVQRNRLKIDPIKSAGSWEWQSSRAPQSSVDLDDSEPWTIRGHREVF